MAIQGYNFGYGNMNKVLNKASERFRISVESLINDKDSKDWLKYRDELNAGDNNYIEHVVDVLKEVLIIYLLIVLVKVII